MGIFTPDFKKMDRENDIDGLLLLLKKRSPGTRLNAFNILAQKLERDDFFRKTEFLLYDRDGNVKNTVIIQFCKMGNGDVFDPIRSIITGGKREDRIKALRALSTSSFLEKEPLITLLLQVLNDDKLIVQAEVMRVLGHIGSGIIAERLIEKLNDRHYQLRIEAVKSLALSGGDLWVDHIIGAMVDRHPLVRREAKKSLEHLSGERARRALGNRKFINLVRAMNENFSVRLKAIREIGEKLLTEGIPLLLKACHDGYKSMRIESVKSLASFKSPVCTGILTEMLNDKYWDVRFEAVRGLGKIRDTAALAGIQYAMKDGNFNVRSEANMAYDVLRKKLEGDGLV